MRHERIERNFPVVKISIPKATPNELQRGEDAAIAVFSRAGISPAQAADGISLREAWDIAGFPDDFDISDQDMDNASVWDEADHAAVKAACAQWAQQGRSPPLSAHLQLVTDPATQLVDRTTALALLRSRVEEATKPSEYLDATIGDLAWIVAADVEDERHAQELVNEVTIAFTALQLSSFRPVDPVDPKRQAVLNAIDTLEKRSG
ncbi:MAG: hypothetical protein M9924_21780 [Rhizobiaceae bacterium]|nr:hypothetical protein [Rhizobiaceae bacterium]